MATTGRYLCFHEELKHRGTEGTENSLIASGDTPRYSFNEGDFITVNSSVYFVPLCFILIDELKHVAAEGTENSQSVPEPSLC